MHNTLSKVQRFFKSILPQKLFDGDRQCRAQNCIPAPDNHTPRQNYARSSSNPSISINCCAYKHQLNMKRNTKFEGCMEQKMVAEWESESKLATTLHCWILAFGNTRNAIVRGGSLTEDPRGRRRGRSFGMWSFCDITRRTPFNFTHLLIAITIDEEYQRIRSNYFNRVRYSGHSGL